MKILKIFLTFLSLCLCRQNNRTPKFEVKYVCLSLKVLPKQYRLQQLYSTNNMYILSVYNTILQVYNC